MNRNPPNPDSPAKTPTPESSSDANQGAEAEVVVEHDPTLKWIISDFADVGVTPPPVTVPGRRAPTPGVRPIPEARGNAEPSRTPPLVAVLPPPPATSVSPAGTGAEGSTAAPSSEPQEAQTSQSPAGEYHGATPSDFFTADPTPPPPSSSVSNNDSGATGAAPTTVLSATGGSDSELSDDAVELVSGTSDGGVTGAGPRPEEVAARTNESASSAGAIVLVEESLASGTTEPREVESDALEELESSENQIQTEAHEAPAVTPPPVPAELSGRSFTRASEAKRPTVTSSPAGPRGNEAPPAQSAESLPQTPSPPSAQKTATSEEEQPASVSPGSQDAESLPEALARRSLQKRSKPWYEEVFDEDYLRTLPFMTPDQTSREVSFIREALVPPPGGEVLDIGCGYGRHALELAQDGLRLTGLDLSLPLLIRAADHAQKRGLSVNFVHADMREMTFNAQFDAAYCVLSTFGYFDEETNLRVASSICRALKPGGRFLLDILNRDYIVGDLPSRVWWEGDGCVVLEEVDFNYHTSRVLIRRSVVFGSGRQSEQEISMRAYSLHELGKLLRQAGFRVLDISGGLATKSKFFGAASRNIMALCERPAT
jgi:SAM-dependent methyltransferase